MLHACRVTLAPLRAETRVLELLLKHKWVPVDAQGLETANQSTDDVVPAVVRRLQTPQWKEQLSAGWSRGDAALLLAREWGDDGAASEAHGTSRERTLAAFAAFGASAALARAMVHPSVAPQSDRARHSQACFVETGQHALRLAWRSVAFQHRAMANRNGQRRRDPDAAMYSASAVDKGECLLPAVLEAAVTRWGVESSVLYRAELFRPSAQLATAVLPREVAASTGFAVIGALVSAVGIDAAAAFAQLDLFPVVATAMRADSAAASPAANNRARTLTATKISG